jgi:hypothetical protein
MSIVSHYSSLCDLVVLSRATIKFFLKKFHVMDIKTISIWPLNYKLYAYVVMFIGSKFRYYLENWSWRILILSVKGLFWSNLTESLKPL